MEKQFKVGSCLMREIISNTRMTEVDFFTVCYLCYKADGSKFFEHLPTAWPEVHNKLMELSTALWTSVVSKIKIKHSLK